MKQQLELITRRGKVFTHLAVARRLGLVRPIVADLFLTLRCNGACNYCYRDQTIPAEAELTTAQWLGIIDDLQRLGCRMVNLMGGDPLLRRDLPEILDHAGSLGLLCDLNTNGFLLPRHLDVAQKAHQIFTSLDGDEVANDLNRGTGAYRRTLDGIRAAAAASIPIRVNATVTRHSRHSVDHLVELADRHGFFLTFTPLVRVRDALHGRARDLAMSDRETREAFGIIRARKAETPRIMNSEASLDFIINYPTDLNTIVPRSATGAVAEHYTERCPYGRLQHLVISNGDVYPCHNMWNDPGFTPKNVVGHGAREAVRHASRLWCRYCWFGNLVEWNEFTSLSWLQKGIWMTLLQAARPGSRRDS